MMKILIGYDGSESADAALVEVGTGSGSDLVAIDVHYFAKNFGPHAGPGRYRSLY